jgi:hypothetical protein
MRAKVAPDRVGYSTPWQRVVVIGFWDAGSTRGTRRPVVSVPVSVSHPRWSLAVGAAGMALQRSRKHKMIAGVCGGIAEWLGWDPTVVRVLYVVVSILSAAFRSSPSLGG